MKFTDRVKAATGMVLNRNSLTNLPTPIGKRFWKYGSGKPLIANWSQTVMSDDDMYAGYGYAAINRRATKTAQLAQSSVKTTANKDMMDKAKKLDEDIEHPYLKIIDESRTFSNYAFWHDISTYLDLEGVFYLFALRNSNGEKYGDIQYFKLLNPFNIRKVINKSGEVAGYVETRDGMIREIPPEMIIPIYPLNPMNNNEPYSMADAARDSQYTIKQAGDHARQSIQKSINSPGIITVGDSDIELDDEQFENFKNRVTGREKGEPIFGVGKGSIDWKDMQVDLNKSALKDVNEISLQTLIAVAGTSKTTLGIEVSGVTRDTSKTQKDSFTEDIIMAQLQLIIDALNQDYKNHYPDEYKKFGYNLYIDNPLGSDHEAELKDIEVKTKSIELLDSLVERGYNREAAAKYVCGDIDIDDLGEPVKPEDPPQDKPADPPKEKPVEKPKDTSNDIHNHEEHIQAIHNELSLDNQGIVTAQQSSLQNSISNIEQRMVATVIDNLTNSTNAVDSENDLLKKQQRQSFENEVELTLAAFLAVIIPLYAANTMLKRTKETEKLGAFQLNRDVKATISRLSKKVSESHINTVMTDLYDTVRELSAAGVNAQELISGLRKEYTETISQVRAKTIARTETNRAFSTAQYEADKQFIKQNKLQGRVYKQWVTRSPNPCAYCQGLAAQEPVPFDVNFADLGDELSYSFTKKDGESVLRKMVVDFEPISNGTAHPNCACTYRLIIE